MARSRRQEDKYGNKILQQYLRNETGTYSNTPYTINVTKENYTNYDNGSVVLTDNLLLNIDLDIINFSKKVFSSEYLRFDKSVNENEIHKVIYGY